LPAPGGGCGRGADGARSRLAWRMVANLSAGKRGWTIISNIQQVAVKAQELKKTARAGGRKTAQLSTKLWPRSHSPSNPLKKKQRANRNESATKYAAEISAKSDGNLIKTTSYWREWRRRESEFDFRCGRRNLAPLARASMAQALNVRSI